MEENDRFGDMGGGVGLHGMGVTDWTMIPDQERWAEAGMVLGQHGARAPVIVAERIGALAIAGDFAGVTRCKEIAYKLQQLMFAGEA